MRFGGGKKKILPVWVEFSCDSIGARTQDLLRFGGGTKKRALKALSVIPLGLEPKTYCLEGSCSIQLSYGTIQIGCKISVFFVGSQII